MSRGTDFLESVTVKINRKIEELRNSITDIKKDIDQMNEYYWLNYTEMDEYGYEDYDNQQALLAQMSTNETNQQTLQRLEKMVDAPFFGSVEFQYEDEEAPETFYIGIGNFALTRGDVPLIYDWRAPVSSLFYDYDKGTASYDSPAGVQRGEILSKWQYKIRGGKMIYELESDIKIDDEILLEELKGNSDTSLKNIVRTIQREQNAIIRNTKDTILVIQGAAGSGKTSVALHRIAYLLYHDRENLSSANVLVLSPNSVFSDYISHILPELGEENIREMSLDVFAYRELSDLVYDTKDRYDLIEAQMAGMTQADEDRYRFKQSKEFVRAMEGFLIELEDRLVDFTTIAFGNYEMSDEQIRNFYYDKCGRQPMLNRMDQVAYFFVDEYETISQRDLDEDELSEIQEQFQNLYASRDVCEIYNWFLAEQGYPLLPEEAPEQRVLDYEDVYPLLYLKYRLKGRSSHEDIRHLVVDEMQDYSYLQYTILQMLFPCHMTILGDQAQSVDETWQDVRTFLPDIFGRSIRQLEMKKSYRNTTEIAAYAKAVWGDTADDTQYMDRPGKPVETLTAGDPASAAKEILSHVCVGEAADQYETAAVLTLTEKEAQEISALLTDLGDIPVSYIDRNSSRFEPGITVTPFYLAKGLEFDQVFLPGTDKENPLYRQYQYIGATRALHELYVCKTES